MNVVVEKGSYHHWRQPTIGESRWMVWAGLAEGAKGVVVYQLMPAVNERKAGDPPKQVDLPANVPRAAEEYNTGGAQSLLYCDSTKEVSAELTVLMPVKDVRSLATGTAAPLSRDDATGMQKTAMALTPGGGAILALTPADGSDVVLAFSERRRWRKR